METGTGIDPRYAGMLVVREPGVDEPGMLAVYSGEYDPNQSSLYSRMCDPETQDCLNRGITTIFTPERAADLRKYKSGVCSEAAT